MKAAVQHDLLSGRQIKGICENADYIPMKRPFGALHIEAKRCSSSYGKKKKCVSLLRRGDLCHLVDELKQ